MSYEPFFLELDEIASFEGESLYQALMYLGIKFRLFYGRLEIESIEDFNESKLSASQKEYFYQTFHDRVGILKIEYLKQNSILKIEYPSAYLNDNKELIIPSDCHARYRYWLRNCDSSWKHLEKSLSLRQILLELKASSEVMSKYVKLPESNIMEK